VAAGDGFVEVVCGAGEAQVADLVAKAGQDSKNNSKPPVVGRTGETRAEAAAGEIRSETGPARGTARRDDAAQRLSRPGCAAPAALLFRLCGRPVRRAAGVAHFDETGFRVAGTIQLQTQENT
jgi:hypothetical protein